MTNFNWFDQLTEFEQAEVLYAQKYATDNTYKMNCHTDLIIIDKLVRLLNMLFKANSLDDSF